MEEKITSRETNGHSSTDPIAIFVGMSTGMIRCADRKTDPSIHGNSVGCTIGVNSAVFDPAADALRKGTTLVDKTRGRSELDALERVEADIGVVGAALQSRGAVLFQEIAVLTEEVPHFG